jgi:hypothetical protein
LPAAAVLVGQEVHHLLFLERQLVVPLELQTLLNTRKLKSHLVAEEKQASHRQALSARQAPHEMRSVQVSPRWVSQESRSLHSQSEQVLLVELEASLVLLEQTAQWFLQILMLAVEHTSALVVHQEQPPLEAERLQQAQMLEVLLILAAEAVAPQPYMPPR